MNKLQNYLKEHGIKINWLAEKLGISYTKVVDAVSGRTKLTAELARSIANVLGCTLEEIIDD